MRSLRILIVVSALAGVGGSTALAQYPAPGGNILLVPSNPAPSTNAAVSLAVTVRDAAGKPIGTADCSAVVKSQPGNGASVLPAAFKTSADGGATLSVQTGDKSGEVRVEVTCGTVSVGGVLGVIAPGSAAPTVTVPRPPDTGTGRVDDSGIPTLSLWFAAGAVVLLASGAVAVGLKRRGIR